MAEILRRNWAAALLVILVFCSGFPDADELPSKSNWVHAYSLFLQFKETDEGLVVLPYPPRTGAPAERAGIQPGDIIVSVKGHRISGWDLRRLMNVNIGEDVLLKVNRHGRLHEFWVRPRESLVRPSVKMLLEILGASRKKVALAIAVTSAENTCVSPAMGGLTLSKMAALEQVRKDQENVILSSVGKHPNFTLVEGSRIQTVMKEWRLNASGPVSEQAMIKVGKMVGATYLLLVSEAAFRGSSNACWDKVTARLVDLESGTVVAVDWSETERGK
jgi:membrane-associated protease RseP (regulator of RpoE activity)